MIVPGHAASGQLISNQVYQTKVYTKNVSSSGTLESEAYLNSHKLGDLPIWCFDGRHSQQVPEWRSILSIVQQSAGNRLSLPNGVADLGDLLGVCSFPLQESTGQCTKWGQYKLGWDRKNFTGGESENPPLPDIALGLLPVTDSCAMCMAFASQFVVSGNPRDVHV